MSLRSAQARADGAPHFHLLLSWVKLWDWEIYRCGHWMFHILQPFLATSLERRSPSAPPIYLSVPEGRCPRQTSLHRYVFFFFFVPLTNDSANRRVKAGIYMRQIRLRSNVKQEKRRRQPLGVMELEDEMWTPGAGGVCCNNWRRVMLRMAVNVRGWNATQRQEQ